MLSDDETFHPSRSWLDFLFWFNFFLHDFVRFTASSPSLWWQTRHYTWLEDCVCQAVLTSTVRTNLCVCVCVCVCNVSSMLSRWVFSLQRRASLLLWQDRKGQSTGGKLSSTAMRASHFVLNRSQKCTDKQTAAVHRRPRFTAESEREISACLTTMILL